MSTTTLVRGVTPAGSVRKNTPPTPCLAGYRLRRVLAGLYDVYKPGMAAAAYRGVTASLCDCWGFKSHGRCKHTVLAAFCGHYVGDAPEVIVQHSDRAACALCGGPGVRLGVYVQPLRGTITRTAYACRCKGGYGE